MSRKNPLAEENNYLREQLDKLRTRQTWVFEPHRCMDCSGRIMRCVTGNGMSPGGNPMYKCADCGKCRWALVCDICWCRLEFKNQVDCGYQCVEFKKIEDYPGLLNAFRSCGCEPPPPWGTNARAGDIGILTKESYRSNTRNT